MFPRFGTIPILDEPIPAYFTMLMIGFAVATFIGVRWAKRTGLDHQTVIDLGLFSLIAGVIGSRLLHVLADGYFWDYVHLCTDPGQVVWRITERECREAAATWDQVAGVCRPAERDCFAWAAFWRGGLTYYGGLIAASGYGLWFLKREGFPPLKGFDMAGMTIPVGLFFGRLGCFLGGCCFGQVTTSPIGVSFPAWSPASRAQHDLGLLDQPWRASLPVHPAQLYESFGCLVLAALLMLVVHPRKRFDGQVGLSFLMGYAALRFGLEFFRADARGGMLGLSTSQLIGVAVILACGALIPWLAKRATGETKE